MALEKLNRQARNWTIFKLIVLFGIIGAVAFLLWQGVGTTPSFTAPTITTPPVGIVGQVVEFSGGGAPNGVVEIAVNSETIGRTRVGPTGRWEYALPSFTEAGDYDISASAVDLYTQTAQPTHRQTTILTIQEALPETVSQQPSPTPTNEPSPTTEPTPTATPRPNIQPPTLGNPLLGSRFTGGDVTLRGTGTPNSQIQILLDGELFELYQVDSNGRWSAVVPLNTPGEYQLIAQALYPDGTIAAESEPKTVTVIEDLTPTIDSTVVEPTQPQLRYDVPISGAGVPGTVVEILVDGQVVAETTVDNTGSWSAVVQLEPPADYVITARALSEDGNVAAVSQPQTITAPDPLQTFTPFVLPPDPEDDIPADGRFVLRGEGVPNSTIQLLLNGDVVDTVTPDANGLFTVTAQLTDFGDNELQVQTVDESGNILSEGEPFTYTYVNRLAIDPILEEQAALSETLQISGSAVANSEVQILVDGEVVDTIQADADGRWAYEFLFTEPGDYEIVAQALDEDGTVLATSTQPITVEDTAEEGAPDEVVELESSETISTALTIIEADGQFNTLLTALETAALTETLNSSEPFVLFAPSDAAFAALPAEAVTALLENPDALTDLLLHHVTANVDELTEGQQITTAAGDELLITEQDGTLFIGRAQVLSITETAAGTLYTIDQLLIPTAAGITPPVIDDSGVPTYEGPFLTVVGTAEPETRLVLMINGELYGETAVAEDGTWLVDGIINPPGEFNIIAYTLSDDGLPLAVSPSVLLIVD